MKQIQLIKTVRDRAVFEDHSDWVEVSDGEYDALRGWVKENSYSNNFYTLKVKNDSLLDVVKTNITKENQIKQKISIKYKKQDLADILAERLGEGYRFTPKENYISIVKEGKKIFGFYLGGEVAKIKDGGVIEFEHYCEEIDNLRNDFNIKYAEKPYNWGDVGH